MPYLKERKTRNIIKKEKSTKCILAKSLNLDIEDKYEYGKKDKELKSIP